MRSSSSTPAGIFTDSVLCRLTRPAPSQVGHGSGMILPVPWHCGQVCWMEKKPCDTRTWPWPWQVGQVCALRAGLGAASRGRSRTAPSSGCESSPRCRAPPPPATARGCSADPRRDTRRCRGLGRPRRAAEDLAEDIAERVGESAEALRPAAEAARTGRAEAHRRIDAGVAELIVGGALLGVGEDLVGFLRFLEFLLGALVVRIAVRMMLHRELPVRLLDVLLGSIAIDAEYRVVVALRHSFFGL